MNSPSRPEHSTPPCGSLDLDEFLKAVSTFSVLSSQIEEALKTLKSKPHLLSSILRYKKLNCQHEPRRALCPCGITDGTEQDRVVQDLLFPFSRFHKLMFFGLCNYLAEKRISLEPKAYLLCDANFANFLMYELGYFVLLDQPRRSALVWLSEESMPADIDEGLGMQHWFTGWHLGGKSNSKVKTLFSSVLSPLILKELEARSCVITQVEDDREAAKMLWYGHASELDKAGMDPIKLNEPWLQILNPTENSGGSTGDFDKRLSSLLESVEAEGDNDISEPRIFIIDLVWPRHSNKIKSSAKIDQGIALIKEIRRITQRWALPPLIIVYSAYPYPLFIEQCHKIGADYVVKKDMTMTGLNNAGHGQSTTGPSAPAKQNSPTSSCCVVLWLILWYLEVLRIIKGHIDRLQAVFSGKAEHGTMISASQVKRCLDKMLDPNALVSGSPPAPLQRLPLSLKQYMKRVGEYLEAIGLAEGLGQGGLPPDYKIMLEEKGIRLLPHARRKIGSESQ